jgi:Flp pilus assembly protein TadG
MQLLTINKTSRRGQALVEFALVVPLLILLLLGIMEFGWLVKNQLTVANAARDGARYAAVGHTVEDITALINNDTTNVPGSPGKLTISMNYADSGTVTYSNALADSGTENNAPPGSMVQIIVSIPNQSLTGFFPFLNNRPISISVEMRRES